MAPAHWIVVALAACALAACGPKFTPQQMAYIREQAARPVVGDTPEACDILWGRAVAWVATHSSWRIQTQTDQLIATYGPGDTTKSAFTVNRIPEPGGRCRLLFRAGCGNRYGCDAAAETWTAWFVRYTYGEIDK